MNTETIPMYHAIPSRLDAAKPRQPNTPKPDPAMNDEASPIAIILSAFVAAASALWAALMPAVTEVSKAAQEVIKAMDVNVMDDARLRLVCLAGSIGGALVSVLLFQLPKIKALVAKLVVSGLSGMMFTPILVRHLGLTLDTDTLIASSGLVALLSYSVLQAIVPVLQKAAEKWLGMKVGAPDDKTQPLKP